MALVQKFIDDTDLTPNVKWGMIKDVVDARFIVALLRHAVDGGAAIDRGADNDDGVSWGPCNKRSTTSSTIVEAFQE